MSDGTDPEEGILDATIPRFITHGHVPEVKSVNEEERTVTHLISSESIDRGGDIVDLRGWDVKNYMRNPIVLADHSYSIQNVIGRALSIKRTTDGLEAKTQFYDYGLGQMAWNLFSEGYAKAWSVGFQPKDGHSVKYGARKGKCAKCKAAFEAQLKDDDDPDDVWIRGFHFKSQELLEYSMVAIPMNPDAVANSLQKGLIDRDGVERLFTMNDSNAVQKLIDKIELSYDLKARTKNVQRDVSPAPGAPQAKDEPQTLTGEARTAFYDALLGAKRTSEIVEAHLDVDDIL